MFFIGLERDQFHVWLIMRRRLSRRLSPPPHKEITALIIKVSEKLHLLQTGRYIQTCFKKLGGYNKCITRYLVRVCVCVLYTSSTTGCVCRYVCILDILFCQITTNNIHKSSCGLCFWASAAPLIKIF